MRRVTYCSKRVLQTSTCLITGTGNFVNNDLVGVYTIPPLLIIIKKKKREHVGFFFLLGGGNSVDPHYYLNNRQNYRFLWSN